jgi:N,N'-diacetylchitobiose transport system substrate-binding protein
VKTSIIGLGLVGALTLSACGSAAKTSAQAPATNQPTTTAGPQTIRLWLNGTDTKQEFVDFAIAEFQKAHPNVTVKFERQQWTGIVDKLTTSLSSTDTPDVVELGNTQAQAFEAAGALQDLTDKKDQLGGDDLLQSLVESGTYNGKFYAAPYYAGARIVIYRKDLFQKSGLTVPQTISDFIAAGIKLKKDNAALPNFSGIYFPGKYWYAALPFVWMNGGDIAQQTNGKWQGTLESDGSIKGLEVVKQIMDQANGAPKDGDESKDDVAFCHNQIGMIIAPGWLPGLINSAKGCPAMAANLGAFALPGVTAGTTAPQFLGGSDLAISAKSQHKDMAYALLQELLSDAYQSKLAGDGLLPAKKSLLSMVPTDEASQAQATAAKNTRFTPESPNWAAIEAGTVMPDMLVGIAQGGNIQTLAQKADAAITSGLNGQ